MFFVDKKGYEYAPANMLLIYINFLEVKSPNYPCSYKTISVSKPKMMFNRQ
jgi:hypothetical protein